MDSVARSFDPGPPKPISFANGTLKKHRPDEEHHRYRECLRNHAASLGGHAVDGCCEFMPSSSADPAVPTSLTCAACGCHRNFHRRLPSDPRLRHEETDGDDEDEESSEDDDDGERRLSRSRRRSFVSPSPYSSSAPHMLLALSNGGGGGGGPVVGSAQSIAAPITVASGGFQAAPTPRKRFRTKFSAEQKERMQEMSERLGWRLQRKDDALVDEFCRQIGVERVVFKVWMHNNKHNFHAGLSSRGREMGSGDGSGGGEGNGIGGGGGGGGGGADGGGGDSNYVMNGSPSSS